MAKRELGVINDRKRVSPEKNAEYVKTLSRMLACKTVYTDTDENREEYDRFYEIVRESFPILASKAERLSFGGGCFVYVIKGKRAKKNIMLMSHHDVVDTCEGWSTDAFTPTERDGFLCGRGSIDTKTPLFAELQAAEELLTEGFELEGINLYIGSSNNEEFSGDGMVLAAQYFKDNGIHFDTVLDEGGAITEGMIPGVKCKSAVVAVHEKSRHIYICKTKIYEKGHGSLAGKTDSALDRLTAFMTEVKAKKSKIYKGGFAPEVKATFVSHVPYMSFPMNVLFGNFALFSPIIKKIMMGIPVANAMLSTSLAFNTLHAGSSDEPMFSAKEAQASLYLRCVREEDLYRGLDEIKKIGEKYGVEIEEVLRDYCKPSRFDTEAFKTVERVLNRNFPDVAVAPFLLTAGTDARRLTDVADNILRFAPIDLNKEQFASIHGANEKIELKNIGECVLFYKDYIREVAG